MISRRRFLTLMASAGLGTLLAACGGTEAAPTEGAALTTATSAPPTQSGSTPDPGGGTPSPEATPGAQQPKPDRSFSFAYLTLGWAGCEAIDEMGLLEDLGWNMEWQRVDQISALANAFNAGQVDIIDMSVVIAAQMFERGVDLRVFGAAVGTLGAIVVAPDSDIQSVEDLRGRSVAGVPGATTTQDLVALVRNAYDLDLLQDTEFVQGSAPPDVANLLINGEVEAALAWEPTTARLTEMGTARILTTQQELWQAASGTDTTQVHVTYVAPSSLAEEFPELLTDINAAQEQIAGLWTQGDESLVQAFSAVTQLPPEVISVALERTVPLYGLNDELKETIAQQLKFNRENGVLLQDDRWLDTERVKAELFWPTS